MEANNYVRNLADLFRPIENYCIDYVEATTFSLDAVVVLSLLKNIYGDSVFFSRTKVLDEALKYDKLRVFYQKDKFSSRLCKEPYEQIYIDKLLSKICVPVEMEKGYCFHPKITLICFRNEKRYIYRLGIASKNLSLSKMDEVIVVDETKPDEKYYPMTDSKDVNELIAKIKNLCFENMHVVFQSMDSDSVFEAMKLDRVSRMIAISPGFDSTKDMFCKFKNGEEIEYWHKESSHTKMYYLEKQDGRNEIWAGSSNCTANGLGFNDLHKHNYECMACVYTDIRWEDFQEAITEFGFEKTDIEYLPQYEGSDFDSSGLEAFINSITELKMEIEEAKESDSYICTLCISSSLEEEDIRNVQCIFCGKMVHVRKSDNRYSYQITSDVKSVSNIVIFQKKDKKGIVSRSMIADISHEDLYRKIYKGISEKNPIHSDEKLLEEIIKTDMSGDSNDNVNGRGNNTGSVGIDDCIYEKLLEACIQNFDNYDRLEGIKKLCGDDSLKAKIDAVIMNIKLQ